jgi:ATP-binding cassette, subfamily F, member 3
MISLEHIDLYYGDRALFDDVSFLIGPHDRIGLVGSNGAGKTTLLKIAAGLQSPDSGKVEKAHYVTAGYLPQDGISTKGKTLYKEAETAFEDVLALQKELDEAHELLTTLDPSNPVYGETIEIMGELQHKLEDLDVYRMKGKIERILMGLGFSTDDFERQTEEFSGGWQMRIALAKLLLQEPSLLLLDEPTNHLDLETLQWLEEYLRQYNGAIVLVSHDRTFLDNLCRRTFALSRGELHEYSGNYSFYEREKEVRKTLLMNAQKNQQQQLKQTQQFIDRFRYKASKARQVQSRIKQLEKVDRIEVDQEEEEIHFRFPQPESSGRVVLELNNVEKSYGDKQVFAALDYKIERGDKIAIVGVNGAGKSTFSRIVAGTESIGAGERILGYNVTASYFAQDQAEELDSTKEVIEILDEVATGEVRKKVRTILGSFLFQGDDVFKKISVLSGGEKSRVALAKMLLQPSNFLIMDEPTNHLDMRSKRVLQEALQNFEGTYIIVSHDRSFLDSIVNKVLEFSHGQVRTYLGSISEYLLKKKSERDASLRSNQPTTSTEPQTPHPQSSQHRSSSKQERQAESNRRKELNKKLQPLKKRMESMEADIQKLEARKEDLELTLADPELYKRGDEAKSASNEYKEVQLLLEAKYADWSLLTEEMAKIEKPGL